MIQFSWESQWVIYKNESYFYFLFMSADVVTQVGEQKIRRASWFPILCYRLEVKLGLVGEVLGKEKKEELREAKERVFIDISGTLRLDVVLAARGCCLISRVSCWFDERPPNILAAQREKCAVWGGSIVLLLRIFG